MNYLIGDLQGCCDPLMRLLQVLDYSPSRDRLYFLGDLVNRGPQSLGTLRWLTAQGSSAHCILGNHDLHLLATSCGARRSGKSDTLDDILNAPDRETLLHWLRHQPLARHAHGWLLVHAGVLPQWDTAQTLALADEVNQQLRGPHWQDFMHAMYGDQPDQWSDTLQGHARLRCIVNALTRLRFCNPEGRMDLHTKDSAAQAPEGMQPWFQIPTRRSASERIAFGHWSTLGLLQQPTLLGLDSGCIWGGQLSAAQLDDHGQVLAITQVDCPQAQRPGKA
ncbi:symmetrical bis(5'-nucleosyl)-tetraphosphatase [Roseateles sp. BYS180W]|uniref:bis(5'-nucleosyl)-tetraphosphatase (symmetrical) n=1 Tax=Roseateles rivi TaxID=3299028 RepID=A0ABW7FYP5_9BURK